MWITTLFCGPGSLRLRLIMCSSRLVLDLSSRLRRLLMTWCERRTLVRKSWSNTMSGLKNQEIEMLVELSSSCLTRIDALGWCCRLQLSRYVREKRVGFGAS